MVFKAWSVFQGGVRAFRGLAYAGMDGCSSGATTSSNCASPCSLLLGLELRYPTLPLLTRTTTLQGTALQSVAIPRQRAGQQRRLLCPR